PMVRPAAAAPDRSTLRPPGKNQRVKSLLARPPALHDGDAWIRAERVAKLRRTPDAPQRKIGALADAERATIVESQGPRRVACGTGQRLLRRQAKQRAGHAEREQQR